MSALPNDLRTFALNDSDSQETREWMDALSAVIQTEGPERAHYLLEQLLEHARENLLRMLGRDRQSMPCGRRWCRMKAGSR